MPTMLNVYEAKSNFSVVLAEVENNLSIVTIMRYGRPIAKIVPIALKRLLFSFALFLCFASWGRSYDASVNRLFVPTTSFSNAVVAVSKFTEHNKEMGSVIALESHRTVASTNEWWEVEMIDAQGRCRFATVRGGVVTNCEFGVSPSVSMRQEVMSMPVLDILEIYHRFTLRYPQHEAVIGCRYGLHSGTWHISCLGMLYTISPGGEWKAVPDPLPKSRKSGHKMPEVEIEVDI